tara:strand:+ start:1773 stop:2165 length:393 start_codon:yes stop_codon:yes gene_type:complete
MTTRCLSEITLKYVNKTRITGTLNQPPLVSDHKDAVIAHARAAHPITLFARTGRSGSRDRINATNPVVRHIFPQNMGCTEVLPRFVPWYVMISFRTGYRLIRAAQKIKKNSAFLENRKFQSVAIVIGASR